MVCCSSYARLLPVKEEEKRLKSEEELHKTKQHGCPNPEFITVIPLLPLLPPPRRFWSILTIFDQVVWPSRLVLGKKFFWIWFIYALEGIVLAWQFFLTTFPIWNTLVYTFCVSYFKDTCGDLHWTATSTSVSSISFLEPCVQTLQGVKGILDIELRYWYRVLHRKFYQIDYWVGGHFGLGKTLFEANMSRV